MAIVDKNSKNWYKVDRDEDVFIGLKLPFVMGNGLDASTLTTIEAVKQNLLNLCSTEAGERVMQPNLGVKLKRFLFEPFSEEIKQQVKEVVLEAINYWLPFLIVNNIIVDMSENQAGDFKSTMEIEVNFSLKKDPTTTESVQVSVSGS